MQQELAGGLPTESAFSVTPRWGFSQLRAYVTTIYVGGRTLNIWFTKSGTDEVTRERIKVFAATVEAA